MDRRWRFEERRHRVEALQVYCERTVENAGAERRGDRGQRGPSTFVFESEKRRPSPPPPGALVLKHAHRDVLLRHYLERRKAEERHRELTAYEKRKLGPFGTSDAKAWVTGDCADEANEAIVNAAPPAVKRRMIVLDKRLYKDIYHLLERAVREISVSRQLLRAAVPRLQAALRTWKTNVAKQRSWQVMKTSWAAAARLGAATRSTASSLQHASPLRFKRSPGRSPTKRAFLSRTPLSPKNFPLSPKNFFRNATRRSFRGLESSS